MGTERTFWARWQEWMISLARALWMCRASITVGVVLVPVLGKVPQGVDAVQGLSEDLDGRWLVFGAAMFGCALVLWYCARLGTYMHRWEYDACAQWTARLSGLFPCAGVMLGAWNASSAGAWSAGLRWIMVIAACACGLEVALSTMRRCAMVRLRRRARRGSRVRSAAVALLPARRRGDSTDDLLPRASLVVLIGLVAMAAAVLVLVSARPDLAVGMGTVTLVLIAGMGYAAVGTALVAVDRRSPVPVLFFLAGWASFLGWVGWTDNHAVRTLTPLAVTLPPMNKGLGAAGPVLLPSVRDTFPRWLEDRRRRWEAGREDDPLRGERLPETPVVLVCAEGGGIYAAYHTAMVLTFIQERAPRFAEHVFAISGVSGGSVGASLWVGALQAERLKARGMAGAPMQDAAWLMATNPPPPAPVLMRDLMTNVLGSDLLTRVLAYGLGADMLAALVPFLMDWADRAVQLEKALEKAAQVAFGVPVMGKSFYNLWPGFTGLGGDEASLPYLFLNTTSVETGGRVMVSPLSLRASVAAGPRTLAEYTPEWNVALSTAAVLSARFPYVTPAGLFERTFHPAGCPAGEGRLADGGYFDSAGATTLDEILQEIESVRDSVGPFRVLVLRIGAVPTSRAYYARASWPDLLSPPRALLNARKARGREAVDTLRARVRGSWRAASDARPAYFWSEALLDTDADAIPLGWVLSARTQRAILEQLGVQDPKFTRAPIRGTPAYIKEFVREFETGNASRGGPGN